MPSWRDKCNDEYKDILFKHSENWKIKYLFEKDVEWSCGDGGMIHGQCDDPNEEEDNIASFLAVILIYDTVQAE